MLDFNAPNGYKVRCYAGDTVYISDLASDRVVAVYTPRHGDCIYLGAGGPSETQERREALAYGKQWLRTRQSDQPRDW